LETIKKTKKMVINVNFASKGCRLAGHLYRPNNISTDQKTPAIVMAGPMTSVKEETLPNYARRLAGSGYTVLTFDHRNFGESEGLPRQHFNTYEQVEDLKNAISYMLTRHDIEPTQLGLCCVCMGAGYGLEVAAFDKRVQAVALIAGGYNTGSPLWESQSEKDFTEYLINLNTARQKQYETDEVQYIPVIAGPPNYAPAAMPAKEPYEFYSRAASEVAPNWVNRLTIESLEYVLAWNVVEKANLISKPLLIVHGTVDELLPPKYAQDVYDRAKEPKELFWIETHNHIELYDQEPYVSKAVNKAIKWFDHYL
jgi:uncharacterized protein